MYTLLVKEDNTVIATERQRIMQNSKLVDTLQIIVPKKYNGLDIEPMSLMMVYKTPISHELKMETLVVKDSNYKDDYLLYSMPIDTDMTAEVGNLELKISFIGTYMDADGQVITQNRETDTVVINIIPISNWFVAPDPALDQLAQLYIANQQNIQALADVAAAMNATKVDDIELDVVNGYIYLVSNGQRVGTPIPLDALGNALADKTKAGLVKINT